VRTSHRLSDRSNRTRPALLSGPTGTDASEVMMTNGTTGRPDRDRTTPASRSVKLAALPLAVAAAIAGCSQPVAGQPEPAEEPMAFGVLNSSCEPGRLAQLREAGVTVVEVALAWDRYQPREGSTDRSYADGSRSRIEACRDAGMDVVLSPGLQYAPSWVRSLPGGTFTGSAGGRPDGVDLVFSAAVRDAAADYLNRLAADIELEGVTAIRVGTTTTGELGYPGPDAAGHAGEYWAFGAAPQDGDGLADGMTTSPLPGWRPGEATWNGEPVTTEQVDAWFTWYTRSAVDALAWQIDTLRDLGFTGRVHLPVAGRGARRADRADAVANRLDGPSNPDGALERGLNYPAQFAVLAARDDASSTDIDFTGLDDVSAVRARDTAACLPGDTDGLTDRTDLADWSGQRFTSAAARAVRLGLVGENPGDPGAPFTGGADDSDPVADQLRLAPDYAAGCGMTTFLFAFEDDLFDGSSGVDVDDYADRIAAAAPQPNTAGR
jgi:hypothetical protein